jgi:hypothetical protein
MYRKLIINLFVVFNFIISCKNVINDKNDKDVIDITRSLNNKDSTLLSSIATNIKYIQLQTDSFCLIGQIKFPNQNIQFYDNKIFIADDSKILSFDSDGNFLTQFGQRGRGPGEYQDIKNFALLPNKEQLVLS